MRRPGWEGGRRLLGLGLVGVLVAGAAVSSSAGPARSAAGRPHLARVSPRGTTTLPAQGPTAAREARPLDAGEDARSIEAFMKLEDRGPAPGLPPAIPPEAPATPVARANPELAATFDGIDHYDQRAANRGNQSSVEPPDQGLCVGRGYVMETVNQAVRIFSTSGTPVGQVTDLNTFYGYPPAVDYHLWQRGPFLTDPSCAFDPGTQRWFVLVLTVDVEPNGTFTGTNHLDVAVSQTSSPVGAWTLYSIPAQDDGTDGTPNHACDGGPCMGDYPHMGLDANGLFISTNEYSLFSGTFTSAQIYALSKRSLVAGEPVIVVHLDQVNVLGAPGFTVWPATAPMRRYAEDRGGTEYFLSSTAAPEAGNTTGVDSHIAVWALTNTSSLDTPAPDLHLSSALVQTQTYDIPPSSEQRPGDTPLGDCLNAGCLGKDPFVEGLARVDSGDSRMQQVVYADGSVWGALDTAVEVGGQVRAGIAWFIVTPAWSGDLLAPSLRAQGYVAVAGQNVTYPAVAALPNGRGAVAFTLVGPDHFPSAAYALLDASTGAGPVHVAAEGAGPSDGFTGYRFFGDGDTAVARWGDYGAAVARPGAIWLASEYIGSTCSYAWYAQDPTCEGTRTQFANWGTRVSRIVP